MIDMTNFLDTLEDDVVQEAAGEADSLVDAVSDTLEDGKDGIETAEPMESLPPIHEGNDNGDTVENDLSVPEIPSIPEEPVEEETPKEPVPYEELEDDSDDPNFENKINSINEPLAPPMPELPESPESPEEQPVPDTTPDPEDKDQGNFDGPMSYIPLYQRRNENDLTGFGSDYHGDTPNNQYDMEEVNTLNELVASEASAMDEYNSAGKKSKLDQLQRLYADISNEERFHLEQLLYAKSLITGEKYIPRDPDVKNEYKELVALGMDEETAMTTAIDKIGLMPPPADAEEMIEYAQEVFDARDHLVLMIQNGQMIMEYMTDDGQLDKEASLTIQEAYAELADINHDIDIFQEAVANAQTTKPINPFVLLGQLIRKIYMAIIGFIKKLKVYVNKFKLFCSQKIGWIKAHGIKGLFGDGINLYFFDEKNTRVDFPNIASYMRLCLDLTIAICENCNVPVVGAEPRFENLFGEYKKMTFKSIEDGINKLKGILVAKSKLIVNDTNEDIMEALFFGVSVNRLSAYNVSTNTRHTVSNNILGQYNAAMETAATVLKFIENAMTNLENLEKQPTSVYYTDKAAVYDPCAKYMRIVVKYMQKMVNGLTADTEEIMKVNNGMMERTKAADELRDRTGKFAVGQVNGKRDLTHDEVAYTPNSKGTKIGIKNKSL